MKILVIQQKMIGDVLASTLICEYLKREFPNSTVHYLINENALAVVEGNPFVDRILLFKKEHRTNKLKFYRFLRHLRKERYDAVIDALFKIETALMTLYTGAKIRTSQAKRYLKFAYTHVYQRSVSEHTELGHAIENRLVLLRPLIENLEDQLCEPKIFLSEHEVLETKQLLRQNGVNTNRPLVMIGMMGSSVEKSYPLNYLGKLLDSLCANHELTLLLNYMPSQKANVARLLQYCSPKTRSAIKETMYAPSLRTFLGILQQCDAYFGNEGGATNMAKALNVPNFSIFCPWMSKIGWFTFPNKSKNRAVHLADFEPEILELPKKERKKNYLVYYNRLTPEMIIPELTNFIKTEVLPHQ